MIYASPSSSQFLTLFYGGNNVTVVNFSENSTPQTEAVAIMNIYTGLIDVFCSKCRNGCSKNSTKIKGYRVTCCMLRMLHVPGQKSGCLSFCSYLTQNL